MNTRRMTKGAVIAIATLSLSFVAACGGSSQSENVASTATPQTSVTPSVTPSTSPTALSTETAEETPSSESTEPSSARNTARDTASTSAAPQGAQSSTRTSEAATSTNSARQQNTSDEGLLPTAAGDYSEGLMQAWTAGDTGAMNEYATSGVVEQLAATSPSGALLRTACEGDMCSYSTDSGSRVTVTFDAAKVDAGAPRAITAVTIDG